tara:strand:- start:248 stop:718 length:471 start_codon:yes stop_codon:yes gene_type:complete
MSLCPQEGIDMTNKCADRVQEAMESRLEDLRDFRSKLNSYSVNPDFIRDLQEFSYYGLSFDYVEPDTFDDQPKGYFRYQLQYGGPTHEIRYHIEKEDVPMTGWYKLSREHGYLRYMARVEFWLLDWFDGACVELVGDDLALALWAFEEQSPHHRIR